jgi:hypothetical protein
MTRALLLAILLVATADAGPFSRSRSYNNDYNRQPSQVLASRITGNVDELPPEPEFYTVAVFPENYGTNPDSQELLRALGTDPTLVALRRATCLQTYAANDPDFRHRFAGKNPETNPDGPFNSVYLRGKTAMCVVDRDGGLVWWLQGGSYRQYAADIERQGVLEEVQLSGMGILRRPRPRVCTPETCPPGTPPSITPNPTDDGPLRPIPSPIDIVETPETVPTVPPAVPPPVTPTIPGVEDGFVLANEIKQLQSQIAALKQQVNVTVNTVKETQAAVEKPFWVRVVDPRGKYTTEPMKVKLGQQIDLILEPIGP